MACDPRQKAGAQQNKSSFFGTLGKIGDVEALNSINGEVGQGLRALETISNQLRTGDGPVAEIWRDVEASVETGANSVMTAVGIDPNTAQDIGTRFNPAVLNRAQGQAETIYDRVRQGNFEIRDVPEAIQDFNNLGQLIGGVFTPKPSQDPESPKAKSKICHPSHWATDLINYAPKHKFMFVMEFLFYPQYVEDFSDLKTAFVVKRTNRPTINFEYEDINYYNFRTKVVKKSEYQPIQMTFYDDMRGNALKFYNRYLQIISPVARGDGQRFLLEESGMTFDQENGVNAASVGPVGNTTPNILKGINLYHIIHAGRQVDAYHFDNPRFQVLALDDLDMADGSTGTEVSLEFNFDRLFLEPSLNINSENFQDNITGASSGGEYEFTFANLPADEQGGTLPESFTAKYRGNGSDSGGETTASSTDAGQLSTNDFIKQQGREATLDSTNNALTNLEKQNAEDLAEKFGASPPLPNFDG